MNNKITPALKISLLFIVPLFLFACSSSTKVRQHPDFNLRAQKANTSLLLPPQVVVQLKNSDGYTRKSDEEAKVIKDINTYVAAELTKRGYKVVSGEYQVEINDKLETATTVKNMTQRLSDKVYPGLLPQTEAVAYKFSLGPEVASLAKPAAATSLIFTSCQIMKRSAGSNAAEATGKVLLGLATMGMYAPPKNPSGMVIFQATMVDAATGDVLWGNETSDVSFTFGEVAYQDKIEDLVADLFKSFPR